MKKAISFLLSVAMVLSLVVLPASAETANAPTVTMQALTFDEGGARPEEKDIVAQVSKDSPTFLVKTLFTNTTADTITVGSYTMELAYDADTFELYSYEGEDDTVGPIAFSKPKGEDGLGSGWSLEKNTTTAGVINWAGMKGEGVAVESGKSVCLGYLLLKFKNGAESGNYDISFVQPGSDGKSVSKVSQINSDGSATEISGIDFSATNKAVIPVAGETPTLTSVSLPEGSDTVTVAGGDTAAQTIQATAASVKGTDLTTSVAWSVLPVNGGVSIEDTGVITVANNAKAGEYTITAAPKDDKVQGGAQSATLTVVRETAVATTITILRRGNGDVAIPGVNAKAAEAKFSFTVRDQYGDMFSASSSILTWESDSTDSHIKISWGSDCGVLTVEAGAQPATVKVWLEYGNVSSNEVTVNVVKAPSEVASVEITTNATPDAVPLKGQQFTRDYTAEVKDQYGTVLTDKTITWSIEGTAPNGVTIDEDSGKVTILPAAAKNTFDNNNELTFTVKATCEGKSATKEITLKREPSTVASASVEGGASVAFIPVGDKDVTTEFYAMGTDQYGQPMGDRLSGVEWSISPDVNGVSIDKSTGVVTVTKNAKIAIADSQVFTVTATHGEVRGTKTITVKRAESVATSLTVALKDPQQSTVEVPGSDNTAGVDIWFTATVKDQYGADMPDTGVTWTLLKDGSAVKDDNTVISIFNSNHVVVARGAKDLVPSTEPVTFTVKAELGELSSTAAFQLKRAESVLDSFNLYKREGTNGEFTLVSQDMIVVPSDDTTKTFQYMAKPVDQYGAEMSTDVAYTLKLTRTKGSVSEPVDGLSFDADTKIGTLTVTKTSPTTKTETLEIGVHAKPNTGAVDTFHDITFSHKDPANVTVADTLDLTYGDERGITATVESVGAKAKWTWTSSDTSVVTASGNTTAATLRALKAGNATVTVTYEDDSRYGTATIEVTVAKKTLTVSAGSYKLSKQYTGKTAGVHGSGELQVTGLVNGDKPSDVIYIYTEEFPTANAGSGEMDVKVKVYSSGAGDWKDKYQLEAASAEDGTVLVKVPYTITPAPLTVGTGSFKSRTYDPANNSAEMETLTLNGAVSNDKLVLGTDYEVTEVRVSNNNVGTQRVSFKVTLKNSNYKWTADDEHVCEVPESAGFTVEITKAPHENATASGSAKYGNTAVVDISSYLPAGYHIGSITTGGDLSVFSNWELGESTFSVSLANNPANVGKQVTFTLPISSTNYASFDLVITVTVNDKLENSLAARDISLTYGDTGYVTVTSIIGSLQTEIASGEDVIALDNGTIKTLKAGTATLKLTASGDENYAEKSIQVKVTVSPKPITLKIDDKSAYVNDVLPALTYMVNGLVGADVLTTKPVLYVDVAEGADPMKQVGTYAIKTSVTPSAGDNYSLTVAEGTLSVTNRPSAITPVGPSAGTVRVDETEGGTVRVTPANAAEGSTVTIVVTPDQGQELRSLEVLDKDGDSLELTDLGGGRFSFEMPRGKVTVKAEFGKAGLPYHDVKEGDWFYSAVEYVTEAGLMGDTGHGSFEPNTNTTRAMIWAILARLSGADTTPVSGPWYSVAQEWAMNSGVSDGTNPNGAITREQLVTMLYRYAETHGIDVTEGGMAIREFADVESVSSFAGPAMTWAVNTGLISGIDGKLVPQGLATRSQVATVLMRFAQLAK